MFCDRRQTDISRSPSKERLPTIEMHTVDGQRQMFRHSLAVVAPTHKSDRGPERAHFLQVWLPIVDFRRENGPENIVVSDPCVEATHKPFDHRLVDSGIGDSVVHIL